MFLSKQELVDLTDYKFSKKQIAWLSRHGYKFEVSRNGAPKVLRKHVEQILGYSTSSSSSVVNRRFIYDEPNFAALEG